MSDIALRSLPTVPASRRLIGAMIAALAILCAFLLSALVPGGLSYPDWAIIPIAEWTGALFLWIKNNFTWLTRGLTAVIDVPLRISMALLAKGYKLAVGDASYVLPRLSWLGICATAALIGHALGGMRLAALGGFAFLYIAVFRQWDSAMLTLALIAVCVPLCAATGLVLGIWGYYAPRLNKVVPREAKTGYDVRDVISLIVDHADFLEVHAEFARNLVVGFGRIRGATVGIVANQPKVLAGALVGNFKA